MRTELQLRVVVAEGWIKRLNWFYRQIHRG